MSWSLSATVVGSFQGGERTEAGISQAYLSFKPMRGERPVLGPRRPDVAADVSLEHEGADWHVADTITPSAINSWIGEEVRPAGARRHGFDRRSASIKLSATAAVFAANDTAGTLLAFRGWALHDRTTLAFSRQPLPPLEDDRMTTSRDSPIRCSTSRPGFADRPGYYAKLAWQPPVPVRIELFHYDNRGDPEAVNDDLEWGWRTQFNNVGAVADLGGGTQLKAQALTGRTAWASTRTGGIWVDTRFRSAFVLARHDFGTVGLAARVEAFDTPQARQLVDAEYDETGWAAMLAAKREFGQCHRPCRGAPRFERSARTRGARPHAEAAADQIQAELRIHW